MLGVMLGLCIGLSAASSVQAVCLALLFSNVVTVATATV